MAEDKTKGTIMVVDDEQSVRDLVAITLKKGGYTVVTATDGKDALQSISHRKFEMVFLDIRMPGFNGHDILTLMKVARPEMQL